MARTVIASPIRNSALRPAACALAACPELETSAAMHKARPPTVNTTTWSAKFVFLTPVSSAFGSLRSKQYKIARQTGTGEKSMSLTVTEPIGVKEGRSA
jgi:hypothetical protein